jgi:SAM-dependent methyltransferase
MTEADELLGRARVAYERRDWPAAYRDLRRLHEQEGLATDDLFALGDAAWWLGLIRETLSLSEQCHRRFLDEGRVDRAAANALEIGFAWFLRGEPTLGSAWISRARRLLSEQFTGFDFSDAAIAAARRETESLALDNAHFEVCDVATLDAPDRCDLITAFDAIHDQAHPSQVLANVAAALRPGGTFLMVDIKASSNLEDNVELPWGPFLYTASTLHCMTVSLALDGDGLGTVWGTQTALRMLGEAGFSHIDVKEIETDPFNCYYVATR